MLATAAMASATRADAQPGAIEPARRAVTVAIHGPHEEAQLLSATILELFARLQLMMLDPSAANGTRGVLAAVDIDLDVAGGPRVVVRSASGTTLLDRQVHDPNKAIEREQIAHAVRGAAEAEMLAEEDRVTGRAPRGAGEATTTAPTAVKAPDTAQAETKEPEPKPTEQKPTETKKETTETTVTTEPSNEESPTSALALDVSTFLGGGPVASAAGPVMRVGGAAALAYRQGLRPSLALSALYAFPFEAGSDTLGSRTRLVSLRAAASIEVLRRRWYAIDAGGGGGLDVLAVSPTSTVLPSNALREETTRGDPILEAIATVRFAVASDVMLTVAAAADFDLASRRYVSDDRGQHGVILEPWTVRPLILVGLSFTAFGGVPFPRPPAAATRTARAR
jgi:hypothetical protein